MLYPKVLLLFNVIERLIEQPSRLERLRIEVHKVSQHKSNRIIRSILAFSWLERKRLIERCTRIQVKVKLGEYWYTDSINAVYAPTLTRFNPKLITLTE